VYRMLWEYPKDRLLVLEDVGRPSVPSLRLPGVEYRPLDLGTARLVPGRLSGPYHVWRALRCCLAGYKIARLSKGFAPEAVLAVAQWEGWLSGAAFAKAAGIPLHLIIHDDWPHTNAWPSTLQPIGAAMFGVRYRSARSRLCVSPYMEEEYKRRYRVSGSVLLPFRDPAVPCASAPPPRRSDSGPRSFTVAYAGTLYTPGYTSVIRTLADSLREVPGRLLLFTPLSNSAIANNGLQRPNVEARGFLPNPALREVLRHEADALFLPMSFQAHEAIPMAMNFPSKLTEYTAVGLPIVIQGPEISSAARWARSTPDAALVVTEPGVPALTAVLRALADDADLWNRLATGALRAATTFDYDRGRDRFLSLIAAP
jgi:hypothetical protein